LGAAVGVPARIFKTSRKNISRKATARGITKRVRNLLHSFRHVSRFMPSFYHFSRVR
jgi:hypothetical protein